MQLSLDAADKWIHIGMAAGALAAAWVATQIKVKLGELKLGQAESKAELLAQQNEVKDDLNEKHRENTQAIAVHQASDEQKFDAFGKALTRIENKLDRINGFKTS
jgi:hypothetical protein